MNWFNFDSLKKRYATLTLLIFIIMLGFTWIAQKQINSVIQNIESNIESRNSLFQRNREIRNTFSRLRNLLAQFQIDPNQFKDPDFISQIITQSIIQIDNLSEHNWIKENYISTINELKLTLNELDKNSQKLIKVRLNPPELFPSLKIANNKMQPQAAIFTQNLNLAIKELDDDYSHKNHDEYQLLIDLRYQWIQMISGFRMYFLNRLNSFQESFLINQLNRIIAIQGEIRRMLQKLMLLDRQNKLSFDTSIALEQFSPAAIEWIKTFEIVRRMNESGVWRSDIVIYQNELEPKLRKITELLRIIDIAIERFSEHDIKTLSNIAQNQVNALWTAAVMGFVILFVGFVFLVKLILNPIALVTHALEDESKGIETKIKPDISVLETKNLVTAFTEMRKQIHYRQEALEYHALHDSLTGLANRDLLKDRLQQAIHNALQERGSFATLIMDLNRFKEVNDTLGHASGDILLQQVAQRLENLLREVDLVVRLGGDEFAVLLTAATEQHAVAIAKKIIHEFETVFTIIDVPLYIGISIGISLFPQHGATAQILQQRADVAMYVAKRNRTGYEIYDPRYDEHSVGRLSLISDLRSAIANNQLYLKYQPVINIESGIVISAEALLRWKHPEHGEIMPDDIIPIAEQTGLIIPITYWVIETAAKFNNRLKEKDINIKIAINLSIYNLQEEGFVENIVNICNKNNTPPSSFIMEVTESAMMVNPKRSIDVLNQLYELGIELAVDDFGTGYSSLTYLKRLPVSKLKIDKSFVMEMNRNDNDAIIVRSTIDLAHNLGMGVTAEGIEDKESLDLLAILGCELGQGYYISRPIIDDAFVNWVTENNDKQVQANEIKKNNDLKTKSG